MSSLPTENTIWIAQSIPDTDAEDTEGQHKHRRRREVEEVHINNDMGNVRQHMWPRSQTENPNTDDMWVDIEYFGILKRKITWSKAR